MAIRYADLDKGANGAQDFVIRHRKPTLPQLLLVFVGALLLSVLLTILIDNSTSLVVVLFAVLGAVGWYVIVQMQRNHDLLLTTEFQNALFASALGVNNKFCIIIRRDGNIVYLDRSFQQLFPDFLRQPRRSVDVLFEFGKVAKEVSAKIFSIIERGIFEKVIFEIRGSDGTFYKIVMSIEPILRPTGFILLRGREYVEKRISTNMPAGLRETNVLNKSTISLFSYVMDTMNMGVYMTSPLGHIVYANPLLEHWLGYEEGEISNRNLSLPDIIHQYAPRSEQKELEDFEGEVTLIKKTGGQMRCFINQKVIHDEKNQILGGTALVHHFIEQNKDGNKKLW